MTSTRLNANGRSFLTATVSALALLSLASTGARADQHEKIDTLQLKINKLQQELEALRERVDEAEKTAPADERVLGPREMQSGMDQVSLTVSGQVNRGVLVADDGDDTEVYFVDNDNSSTRIRLLGDARFNEDISVGSVIEVQFESNSTADVSQDNQRNAGDNNFTERKLEIFADSETYGRLCWAKATPLPTARRRWICPAPAWSAIPASPISRAVSSFRMMARCLASPSATPSAISTAFPAMTASAMTRRSTAAPNCPRQQLLMIAGTWRFAMPARSWVRMNSKRRSPMPMPMTTSIRSAARRLFCWVMFSRRQRHLCRRQSRLRRRRPRQRPFPIR